MTARAFTLLEVLAVVVLMGIIAGATAWSLAENVANARALGLAQRIEAFDRMSRLLATRTDAPVLMRIDLDGRSLSRQVGRDGEWVDSGHSLQWNSNLGVSRVLVVSGWEDSLSSVVAVRVDDGVVRVPVSRAGRSVSYALRIMAPSQGQQDQPPRWLLVCGLTGQTVWMNDESQIEQLLQSSPPVGPEPD